MENLQTGLVLEGGAMRGMFTSGILDVLMENGIKFPAAAAVSAGATFGCNMKSGQIGRAIRYNKTFAHDKRYCSVKSLLTTGDIFNADFCYYELPQKLDPFDYESYKASPMQFFIVATDINTGKAVYHKIDTMEGDEMEWLRASASMPLVSRPVKIGNLELLDGGISDSIPLKFLEEKGYGKNIVILTQPKGFIKKQSSAMKIMKLMLKKYPELIKAMARRHEVYNEETQYCFSQEKKGLALVLCPEEKLGISRTERNPDELQRVYEIGRKLAEKRLDEVKAFIG